MLRLLNLALVADNPTALYVTLAHGMYDAKDGTVLLASGGHPAPLLRRANGKVEQVVIKPAVMLGCSPLALNVADIRIQLAPRETLILYTDGITEAQDAAGGELGVEGFLRMAYALPTISPGAAGKALLELLREFGSNTMNEDDQSLIVLQENSEF